jgi:hypothetical protein
LKVCFQPPRDVATNTELQVPEAVLLQFILS